MTNERFSRRRGYGGDAVDITVRNDAPQSLRAALISIAYQTCGKGPKWLRGIVCDVLLVRPDRGNWTEYPNVDDEVQMLIEDCEWYRVYDIIEEIEKKAKGATWSPDQPTDFATEINRYFDTAGIGWKLTDGRIEARGDDAFEHNLRRAQETLQVKGLATSQSELRESVRSLSVRPEPDVTGAIQHAMAALECVAREVAGNSKLTLGQIIKKNPGMIPPPLDDTVSKAWGFASEQGRHVREGRTPDFAEAELVVGISSAICMYLSSKLK